MAAIRAAPAMLRWLRSIVAMSASWRSPGPIAPASSGEGFASRDKMAFEATPILAQGRLYLSTPLDTVIALDPATGEEIWRHDPGIDRTRRYAEATSRGVSSWRDAGAAPDAPCAHRIFVGTLDGRLIALDGSTGRPCADFGDNGTVDLTVDVRLTDPGQYTITSPPAIAGDLVITGSAIGDNRAVDLELGIVRAFDARSGRRRLALGPDPARSGRSGPCSLAARAGGADRRRQCLVDPLGRSGARSGVHPDRRAEPGFLRRRAQGRQSLRQLDRGVAGLDRRAGLAAAAGASRPLGLRRLRPAGAGRPREGRPQRACGDRRPPRWACCSPSIA